jgi:glycosyltransferase involved in cell wall biosynthesis
MSLQTTEAIVPCFNAGCFIKDSVDSLLSQTRNLDCITLIDDASTDVSSEIIDTYAKIPNVKIVRNSRNLGKAESLNQAIKESTADFIILQDADDVAEPQRVERQVDFMLRNPKLGCSSSFITYINSFGKKIGSGTLDLLTETKLDAYLASHEPFGLFSPAIILRRELFLGSDLRFRSQFWPADDIDLWNRIAEAGWLVLAQPDFLVRYRIHGASAVTSNFHKTRLKFEFVRACLRARRQNLQEPSEITFLENYNRATCLKKINRWRKTEAKAAYRGGGFALAEGKKITAAALLARALFFQPVYTTRRLFQQIKIKSHA